jgi:hypothetical protein
MKCVARHLFSQHDGAAGIEADHVKRVLPISIPTVATARMVERGMVVLLVLTSPDALSEPLGAGARPVHSIRDISLQRNDLSLSGGGKTDSHAWFAGRIYVFTA